MIRQKILGTVIILIGIAVTFIDNNATFLTLWGIIGIILIFARKNYITVSKESEKSRQYP